MPSAAYTSSGNVRSAGKKVASPRFAANNDVHEDSFLERCLEENPCSFQGVQLLNKILPDMFE